MPSKDAKAYALSEKGKASRAKARVKYLAKRKSENQAPLVYVFDLVCIMQKWTLA